MHRACSAGLAGSGLPQQPGACCEGRALGRDGGTTPPAFQRVHGHLQHHSTREANGKRPAMGPAPPMQGLLQAPSLTPLLKGILHASILST